MAKRQKHPHKVIEEAIMHTEKNGWTIEMATGHAWGIMKCPFNSKDCRDGKFCQKSIWSTPKNPGNFAQQIRKAVDGCKKQVKG